MRVEVHHPWGAPLIGITHQVLTDPERNICSAAAVARDRVTAGLLNYGHRSPPQPNVYLIEITMAEYVPVSMFGPVKSVSITGHESAVVAAGVDGKVM